MATHDAVFFGILLDTLHEAFQNAISMQQYMDILLYIEKYTELRGKLNPDDKSSLIQEQHRQLSARKWPTDYDPTNHACTLRFACTFGQASDENMQCLLGVVAQQGVTG